jgi:hypothetical protein
MSVGCVVCTATLCSEFNSSPSVKPFESLTPVLFPRALVRGLFFFGELGGVMECFDVDSGTCDCGQNVL